jgi:hypothetical protein
MPGGEIAEKLIVGAQAGGAVGVAWFVYKILGVLLPYLSQRSDARQARMDAQQARLDLSLDKRLKHLERIEVANQGRIAVLEEAIHLLADELRQKDPANPKLSQVAKMLRAAMAVPRDTPDDMTDLLGEMP